MDWRKAAFAALLAVLVGVSALPLAAEPLIREFPKPFVQNGTIDYDGDGVPDIAIIIGGQKPGIAAAAEDVRGAALIGVKIGSHLYYTKAPNLKGTDYWIEELTADAWHRSYKQWDWGGTNRDEGFWFDFTGTLATITWDYDDDGHDEVKYYIDTEDIPAFSWDFTEGQAALPLDTKTFAPDYLLVVAGYYNETIESIPICPACPGLGAHECKAPVLVYSVGYMLTDDDKDTLKEGVLFADLNASGGTAWIISGYNDHPNGVGPVIVSYNQPWFVVGPGVDDLFINATDIYSGLTYNYSLNKPGFTMIFKTTPVNTAILQEGKEYYVPFLGYWVEVDDITEENASFIVRESEGGPIKTMLNLEYTTDAGGNVNKLFIYYDDLGGNRLKGPSCDYVAAGAKCNMTFFLYIYRIDTDDDYMEVMLSSPWIDKHVFDRSMAKDPRKMWSPLEDSWPADVPIANNPADQNDTFNWWIQDGYFVGYIYIDGTSAADAKGPFAVKMDPWTKLPYDHIYGIVSYTFNWTDPSKEVYWYVIPENGTWHLGETWPDDLSNAKSENKFKFDNIEVLDTHDGTADCGPVDCWKWDDFGVFLYEEDEEVIVPEICYWTDTLTYLNYTSRTNPNQTLDDYTNPNVDQDIIDYYRLFETYPINVTGVFAGVYDRFENITGNWTGTTLLDEYNTDITPAEEHDQVFELEDVFSFVKAPLVWTDYQFLDENYEVINPDLADKNLILVGGPVVNRAVDYLNDTGLLWIVYVGDRLYDMRFYHDGVYEDEGYVDLERVRTWIGAHTVSFVGGLGVIQYAMEDPWGEEDNYILVVAGNNRYGTYAAAVALADPTKVVRVPTDIPTYYYLAGTDEEHPPALIVVALLPGVAPPAPWVPPEHNNIVEITWPTPITVEPVVSPGG